MEEAGRKLGQDIKVVSIDAVKGSFEAIIAGKLNCTVECNPLLGPMAFAALDHILAGKTLPKRTVVVDQLFDHTNAKDAIHSRQYQLKVWAW